MIRYDKNKNSKFPFYIKGIFNTILPHFIFQKDFNKIIDKYKTNEEVIKRLNYYNKTMTFELPKDAITIQEFYKAKKKTYFFDLIRYLKYFPKHLRFSYLFGDITHIPSVPTIVKSRPISDKNQNSVIMKLNSVRHFIFVNDKKSFLEKKPQAVWRGKCYKEHRINFVKRFYDKNFCDIGQTNTKGELNVPWQKEKKSLQEQLNYRYLIAIEGNDVASNLKWAMSSNSLVLMAKPKYDTWFMEGTLQPNFHYALLKDDYSDLEEKINYYNEHPQEAQNIIENAHTHVKQFFDEEKEIAISLMTLHKYFINSRQL